jgi:hypothetical protein
MGHARKAALHLLNNDWSRAVWKRWLSNIFLPPVEPPIPHSGSTPQAELVNTAPSADIARTQLDSSCSAQPSEPPDSARLPVGRRRELRARLEALSDRLAAVEDGLDTLLRRSAHREKSERRSEQQSVEFIDQIAAAAERQASLLEGMLGTVARLEHGLSRLEYGLSRVERGLTDRNRRDSLPPSAGSQPPRAPSQHPESQLAPRDRAAGSTRPSEPEDADFHETSGINGLLSEMSLSTVLAMLEIERHSGRLKVATDEGMLASFELSEGNVVSSRLSEIDADPLQTLRTALRWKQGRFWFRQQPAEAASLAPRSIGSLLLEATRQNDESFAEVG